MNNAFLRGFSKVFSGNFLPSFRQSEGRISFHPKSDLANPFIFPDQAEKPEEDFAPVIMLELIKNEEEQHNQPMVRVSYL